MTIDPVASGVDAAAIANSTDQTQTQPVGQSAADIHVSTMDQLKIQAPEVYKAVIKSMAMQIVQQQQAAGDRLLEIIKKAREESGR